MSAETIPSDVPAVGSVWVKKPNPVTVAASISTGVSYNFDGGSGEATLSRFLQEYEPADRSTRPAEPVAPVAEVKAWLLGDPATGQWIEVDSHRVEYSRGMGTPAHVLASAFQAERARADAAEQRAADALARAEKAEGALEATREDGWRSIAPEDCEVATVQTFGTITLRNSHPAWVRDDDGRTYEAVWTVDDRGRAYWWDIEAESPVDPVAIYPHPLAARASREAQPATDGGDNG